MKNLETKIDEKEELIKLLKNSFIARFPEKAILPPREFLDFYLESDELQGESMNSRIKIGHDDFVTTHFFSYILNRENAELDFMIKGAILSSSRTCERYLNSQNRDKHIDAYRDIYRGLLQLLKCE